jgi:hypothetical protein
MEGAVVKPDVPLKLPYLTYLIRLWRVETEDGPIWRVVLEDPHSAERRGFANLAELYRFLAERTGTPLCLLSCAEVDPEV